MFSTKRPAAKKQRSWETVDADDDDAPSEPFLKLQRELADRDRLAQEKSGDLLAPHTSGPRNVSRCGALSLLQKTPHYRGWSSINSC